MKLGSITLILVATGLVLAACQNTFGPNQSNRVRFDPPNTSFVTKLNISAPVTAEEAKAIAAEAAGGTAISVSTETEKGEQLFEVIVETPTGRMEVEVRASDGAVVEMGPDNDKKGDDKK